MSGPDDSPWEFRDNGSVVDPDPVGSENFSRIWIREKIIPEPNSEQLRIRNEFEVKLLRKQSFPSTKGLAHVFFSTEERVVDGVSLPFYLC
jgi:hypothetical protein